MKLHRKENKKAERGQAFCHWNLNKNRLLARNPIFPSLPPSSPRTQPILCKGRSEHTCCEVRQQNQLRYLKPNICGVYQPVLSSARSVGKITCVLQFNSFFHHLAFFYTKQMAITSLLKRLIPFLQPQKKKRFWWSSLSAFISVL